MASSPSPTTSSSPSSRSPCRSAPVAGLGGLRGRHRFKPLGVSSGRLRPRARRRQRRHRTKVAARQPRVRRRPERHRPPAAHPSVTAYQRMAWLAQASSTRRPRRRRPRATARRALLGTTCQPSSAPPCLRRRETQACLCAAAPAPSPCATSLGKRPKPTFLQARNSRNAADLLLPRRRATNEDDDGSRSNTPQLNMPARLQSIESELMPRRASAADPIEHGLEGFAEEYSP